MRNAPAGDEPSPAVSRFRSFVGAVLLVLAIAYLGLALRSQWGEIGPALAARELWTLAAATALAITMVALKAAYHVYAFRRLGVLRTTSALRIVSAYAGAQVARYLPGKVLGVVYESNRLPEVPWQQVVAANVIQGLQTMTYTVVVLLAIGVWLWSNVPTAGISLVIGGSAAAWAAHRWNLMEHAFNTLMRRLRKARVDARLHDPSPRHSLRSTAILAAEWLAFFTTWALLMPESDAGLRDVLLLGACYSAAALAASFAVLIPSGLVVREAIFLWCGTQLAVDATTLVILGLLSRIVLTLADVLLPAAAWLAGRFQLSLARR